MCSFQNIARNRYQKALQCMPGGVSSPVRAFRELDVTPLMVASAQGDQLFDIDGCSYIDYCQGWGSLILGHAHPLVEEAILRHVKKGTLFGFCNEGESLLAEKILSALPWMEKVRFLLSGTEAAMTAIRLARGVTGRTKIIYFSGHYHGHFDSALSHFRPTGIPAGVTTDAWVLPFNDISALHSLCKDEKYAREIAAVIMEPIATNMGVVPASHEFLRCVREETRRIGALLIFDEVVTGFRVGWGGAQGFYQIEPDLTCLAKIIGGGLPAAALAGKAVWMDQLAPLGPIYHAGTFAGHPLSMQSGFATLSCAEAVGFYERLMRSTDRLTVPVREALLQYGVRAVVQQVGSMFTIFWGVSSVKNCADVHNLDEDCFRRFFRFLWKHGILIPPSSKEAWFVSSAHSEAHLDFTKEVILKFVKQESGA